MAPALPLLWAICAFNTSNYRSAGFLAPCSVDAATGRVAQSAAPALFVSSDSSLCNVAFRAAPRPRFYIPSMPGGEWVYEVNIVDAQTGALEGRVTTAPGMMYTYFAFDALNGELYAYGDLENGTNVGIAQVQATEPSSSGRWSLLDYGVPGWVGAGSFDCSGGFSTLHEPGALGVFYASYIGKEEGGRERTARDEPAGRGGAAAAGGAAGVGAGGRAISTHAIAAYDISQHAMLAAWDTTECMDGSPDTYCQTGDILPWVAPSAPEDALEGVLAFVFVNGTNEPPIQPLEGHVQLVLYQPQLGNGSATFSVLWTSYNASDLTSGQFLTDTFAGTLAGAPGSWLVSRLVAAGQYGTDLRVMTWDLSTTPATVVGDAPLHGPAFDAGLGLDYITNAFAVPAADAPSRAAKLATWSYDDLRVDFAAGAGAPTVVASPAVLPARNSTVAVVINASSAAAAHATDVIAAYSPPGANVSATAPVEFFVVADADPAYLATGSATVFFRLVNVHAPYAFVLLARGKTAVAASSAVTFANLNAPTGVRLAMTGRPDEMVVMWQSATSEGRPRASFLPVGAAGAGAGWANVSATTSSDRASDMCGAPAATVGGLDPAVINTALLTGLAPGQRYQYAVGADSGMSDVFSFTQPPAPGSRPPAAAPLGLAIFGDMGQVPLDGSNATEMMPPAPNVTAAVGADLDDGLLHAVLHIGDLSYACGYGAVWHLFFAQLDAHAVAARAPYHTLLGNHEALVPGPDFGPLGPPLYPGQGDSGGECGTPSLRLFSNPLAAPSEPWYTLRVGLLTAVVFSAEFDFTTGSPQWEFIKAALAAVNKTATPWVILASHRPMYPNVINSTSVQASARVAALLRTHLEPLFFDAQGALVVDATFGGHFHYYQRACASLGGACVQHSQPLGSANGAVVYSRPRAPVHILVGTAGASISCCLLPEPPPYSEVSLADFGYGRLFVHNESHLQWQFVVAADRSVADEAWIVRA